MASFIANLFVASIFYCIYSINAQCNVNIREGLPSKDPLFLTEDGKLWVPSGPSLSWDKSESSVLSCTGKNNHITEISQSETTIKCKLGNKFSAGKTDLAISNANCSSQITGDSISTGKKCGTEGVLQKIGFKTTKFGFIDYIDVCYNDDSGSVIYTYHVIRGQAIDNSVSEPNRPVFKTAGIPSHIKPANSYRQTSQLKRFTELLGSEELAKQYIHKTSFLARGHLAPDNDGIFKTWKSATYFYTNVAPEWQNVNAGNWLRVENVARKKASSLKADLEVYTGVTGVLELKNKAGKLVKISLEPNNKLIVPKYYWKILKKGDEGIAFVTLNNPFADNEKPICNDICAKYGWDNKAFSDYTKGFTYCCKVPDLIKALSDDGLPKEANTKKIMSL